MKSKKRPIKLRSTVRSFAEAMELKLRKHDGELGLRGWKDESPGWLTDRLREELGELESALESLCSGIGNPADEAVDIGNFAMMVHDVVLRGNK